MMWQDLLKANNIPKRNEMDGKWLPIVDSSVTADKAKVGSDYIVNTVKEAIKTKDPRNTVSAREWAKEIAQMSVDEFKGKYPQYSGQAKEIIETVTEVSAQLNEIISHKSPKQEGLTESQHTSAEMGKIIADVENDNFDSLKAFIGKGKQGKNYAAKEDLLSQRNVRAVIEPAIKDNIDFWYVDATHRTYMLNPLKKTDVDEIESQLSDYEFDSKYVEVAEESGRNNSLNIKLTKPLLPSDFEKFITILNRIVKEKSIRFDKSKNKIHKSLLYNLYGTKLSARVESQVVEDLQDNSYGNDIENNEDVLNYFTLLTTKASNYKNEIFMPAPTNSSSTRKATMGAILDISEKDRKSKHTVTPALNAVLTTGTFELSQFMEKGAQARSERLTPMKTVYYLRDFRPTNPDQKMYKHKDLTPAALNELRDKLKSFQGKFKPFFSWVDALPDENKLKRAYVGLEESIPDIVLNQIPIEEAKAIWDLRTLDEEVDEDTGLQYINFDETGLSAIYPNANQGNLSKLEEILLDVLDTTKTLNNGETVYAVTEIADLFRPVNEHLYKINASIQEHISGGTQLLSNLIQLMKTARYEAPQEEVEVSVSEDMLLTLLNDVEEEEWNDPYDTNIVTVQDVLQLLIQLDYAYGGGKLHKRFNLWSGSKYEGEEPELADARLKSMIKVAQAEYSSIIDSFREATSKLIDDIIDNPQKYYEKLQSKKGNKINLLFKHLLEAEIIRKVST